ncbi:MAG: FecR domain-containing protein [Gimesia chilikensis]|uniref:FecR domain-containing protein n=1 Tax=Gimesia chilikensis TaxID=2605989 RepID=UPI0037BDB371
MLSPQEQEELMHLCWEYQYGSLNPRQAARLEKMVLSHDAARDLFVQYAGMCANLEWEGIVDPGPLGRSTTYDPLPSGELRTIPDYLPEKQGNRKWTLLLSSATLLAFCLLGVAYLVYSQAILQNPPAYQAQIIRLQEAHWATGKRNWLQNQRLRTGDQLHLDHGLVELETVSGARIILKGPARLNSIGSDQFRLNQGHLFAHVPPAARGLTVETPTSRVIDLGTRFGLVVNPSHETEVHVIQGLVRLNLLDAAREITETQDLTENTAVRVQPESKTITRIEASPEIFVQNLARNEPRLVAHWKLNEPESSVTARDSGDSHLDLNVMAETGLSPFTNKPAPQNTSTAAGPFQSQLHKLFRTLNTTEAELFDLKRFTITLWARNPSRDRQGDSNTLFHYRNTRLHSSSQFNLYSDSTTGRLGFGFLDAANQYHSWQTNQDIRWDQDRWYRIVFTYDANTAAPNDSIVTYTRTPEFSSTPDLQQTFTNIKDILPLSPGGVLAVGGSTLSDISRHWGGEIADVRFIRGIPDRFLNSQAQPALIADP